MDPMSRKAHCLPSTSLPLRGAAKKQLVFHTRLSLIRCTSPPLLPPSILSFLLPFPPLTPRTPLPPSQASPLACAHFSLAGSNDSKGYKSAPSPLPPCQSRTLPLPPSPSSRSREKPSPLSHLRPPSSLALQVTQLLASWHSHQGSC